MPRLKVVFEVNHYRLKSGSGHLHHRFEICGPSNGRHKFYSVRPPWLLRLVAFSPQCHWCTWYTPSQPNAVFSQFLGSASMTFFLFSFRCFLFLSSCLFLFLFLSFLSFLLFRFLLLSFLFPFLSLLIFSSLFLFSNWLESVTCVCLVIGTTCNIYAVVVGSLFWVASGMVGFSRRE